MGEAGFKNQEAETLQGILVPAGTPKAIVGRLSKELVSIMRVPSVEKRVTDLGFYIIANSPAEFSAQIKSEIEKWGKVIKSAGIKVN